MVSVLEGVYLAIGNEAVSEATLAREVTKMHRSHELLCYELLRS